MTDAVSLATSLKKKLAANDQQRLDSLAEALLESAINKNTTAMKLVVELVEPGQTQRSGDDER